MITKEQFIKKVKTCVLPKLLISKRERGVLIVGVLSLDLLCLFIIIHYSSMGTLNILMCIFITMIIFVVQWRIFRKKQKDKFYPLFLKFLGNLRYGNKCKIAKNVLLRSCLLSGCPIQYGECFSGTFQYKKFSINQIFEYADRSAYTKRLFTGLCIDIEQSTYFSEHVIICNTKINQNISSFQRVYLEDVVFNNYYQVYANNQFSARIILTPILIEQLNHIKEKFYNKRIDIALFENHFLLLIYNADSFSPYNITDNFMDIKGYTMFYDNVKIVYDLIEHIHFPKQEGINKKLLVQTAIQRSVKNKNIRENRIGLLGIIWFFSSLGGLIWTCNSAYFLLPYIVLGVFVSFPLYFVFNGIVGLLTDCYDIFKSFRHKK